MDQVSQLILSRAEFYRWAEEQPSGRYERVSGEVVRMAPARWRHHVLKGELYLALYAAAAGRRLQVAVDGLAVAIDDHDFIPDVIVNQGATIPLDEMTAPCPVIIIEILSPSTARIDATFKLESYFQLPSVEHYLLIRADRRAISHYRRGSETPAHPAIGQLDLDPPGIAIDLAGIYDRAGID